jgi:hypothetical protein
MPGLAYPVRAVGGEKPPPPLLPREDDVALLPERSQTGS